MNCELEYHTAIRVPIMLVSRGAHVTVRIGLHLDLYSIKNPDSKVHGANMGPTWGRQDPGGPHVGHMNLAIWETLFYMKGKPHYKPKAVVRTDRTGVRICNKDKDDSKVSDYSNCHF